MSRPPLLALVACLFALALAGCGDGGATTAEAACTCEDAKTAETGWCCACNVGYVAGTRTDCAGCVKAAQAGTPCPDCALAAGKCPVSAANSASPLADPAAAKTEGCPVEAGASAKGQCKGDCKDCPSKGQCEGDCEDCEKCAGKQADAEAPPCVCERGKAGEPVWCHACKKGYVDGKPAGCEGCVDKAVKAREAAGTDG